MGDTGVVTNNPTETYTGEKYTVKYTAKDQEQEFIFNVDNVGNVNIVEKKWIQNENGEITDGTIVLQIGDYVAYDPTIGAKTITYTSYADKSGYSNDQVFNINTYKTKGYGWRVLGVEDGKILLVAEEFIGPDSGGYTNSTYGTTYYYLQGRVGYIYGANELYNICSIYGQGKYAEGARSILVKDIDSITGFNPVGAELGELYEYENEMTFFWDGSQYPAYTSANKPGEVDGNLTNAHSSGFFWFDTDLVLHHSNLPNTIEGLSREQRKITTLKSTYYGYEAASLISKTDKKYELLFGKHSDVTNDDNRDCGGTGAKVEYWVGESFTICCSWYPDFGFFDVKEGEVNGMCVAGTYGSQRAYYCGVLPVVSLKSEIQLEYNENSKKWFFID